MPNLRSIRIFEPAVFGHKALLELHCTWEQDLIAALPRFPQPKQQRIVAGRHYLTKAELNALHFATYSYIVATNTSGLSLIVIFLCRRRERIDEQGSVFEEIEIVVERESLELF